MGTDAKDRPPRWAESLLRILLKPRDRDTVAGDLLEEYREVVLPARGLVRAQLWYVRQAISLVDGVTLGALLGAAFGVWDIVATWLDPLADDTPRALLIFYGPMFAAWGFAGFMSARRNGRVAEGVKVGAMSALTTFVVFYIANLIRINLFLETIRFRTDWANLVVRFHASGSESFRAFVNFDYVRGAPLKIGVASMIGACTGLIGGLAASLGYHRRSNAAP